MSNRCVDHLTAFMSGRSLAILGWVLVMLAMVVVIWVGTAAHADEQNSHDQMMGISHIARQVGKLVKDPEGKQLGRIQDLVFLWRSHGYTEFAVLSLGGLFGVGGKQLVVPWGALVESHGKSYFVLNVNSIQLAEIPHLASYRFYDRSSVEAVGGRATAATSRSALYDEGQPQVFEYFWRLVLQDDTFQGTPIRQLQVATRQSIHQ